MIRRPGCRDSVRLPIDLRRVREAGSIGTRLRSGGWPLGRSLLPSATQGVRWYLWRRSDERTPMSVSERFIRREAGVGSGVG